MKAVDLVPMQRYRQPAVTIPMTEVDTYNGPVLIPTADLPHMDPDDIVEFARWRYLSEKDWR